MEETEVQESNSLEVVQAPEAVPPAAPEVPPEEVTIHVRVEDLRPFLAPDVRLDEFRTYQTEVVRKVSKTREWTESLVSTVVFVVLFTTFIAQATQVPTASMVPTIFVGDHFFLDKIAFPGNFPKELRAWLPRRQIHRGDIIAFRPPPAANMTTPFVKRVIGEPGDIVEIKKKVVYLNGEAQEEPYKIHTNSPIGGEMLGDNYGPVTVPPDEFFVMGDNRDNSNDSRFWGFVERDNVIGKPLFVYWSYINDAPYDTGDRSWASMAADYVSVARHFFTRTRWFRTGTMVE